MSKGKDKSDRKLFAGCSVQTGQVINRTRQTENDALEMYGIGRKYLRKLQKRAKRTGKNVSELLK